MEKKIVVNEKEYTVKEIPYIRQQVIHFRRWFAVDPFLNQRVWGDHVHNFSMVHLIAVEDYNCSLGS